MGKRVSADIVQSSPIGQLGLPERRELVRRRHQFQLGGHGCFHADILSYFWGKMARATRAVSSGTGSMGEGSSDMRAPSFVQMDNFTSPSYPRVPRYRLCVIRQRILKSGASQARRPALASSRPVTWLASTPGECDLDSRVLDGTRATRSRFYPRELPLEPSETLFCWKSATHQGQYRTDVLTCQHARRGRFSPWRSSAGFYAPLDKSPLAILSTARERHSRLVTGYLSPIC